MADPTYQLRLCVHRAPDSVEEGWSSFVLPDTHKAFDVLRADAALLVTYFRGLIAHPYHKGKPPLTCLRFDLERSDQYLASLPLARWLKSAEGTKFPHHPSGVQVARVRTHEDSSWRIQGGYVDFRTYGGVRRVVDWIPLDEKDRLAKPWQMIRTEGHVGPDLKPLPSTDRDVRVEWTNELVWPEEKQHERT